jgi:hypothetical protein
LTIRCGVRARRVAALLLAIGLASCKAADTGYVELKLAPGFTIPSLHLETTKIEPLRGGTAVLSHKTGPTKLQYEREGRLIPICEINVRKNRIVTVTVSTFAREPRCKIEQ